MKKSVRIRMYIDCPDERSEHCWRYVTTVWGERLEISGSRWYLRDSNNYLVCCGNVCELHGDGSDDFDVNFKNVVCY